MHDTDRTTLETDFYEYGPEEMEWEFDQEEPFSTGMEAAFQEEAPYGYEYDYEALR